LVASPARFADYPGGRFADYVAFEPDAQEAERLREDLNRPGRWRTGTVIPAAVGSREGTATLHVTRNPGMSSLLAPDPDVARRFWLAGKSRVVSTAQVPVAPLDDLAR
jgi:FkbM family methyltransferase